MGQGFRCAPVWGGVQGNGAEFPSLARKQKSGRIRWKTELELNPAGGLDERRTIARVILNLLTWLWLLGGPATFSSFLLILTERPHLL